MKRIGNLFEKITNIENIKLAERKAIKGKRNTYGVQRHLKNREDNLYNIQQILLRGEYFAESVGIINEDTIKKYIENQKNV